jgi:hypothetical protein
LFVPHRSNYPLGNRFPDTRTRQNPIGSEVEIHYPFHPLFRAKVKIVRSSVSRNGTAGTIFIDAPKGFCKEIPIWMTEDECREYHISEFPHINLKAILRAIELLESSMDDLLL